MSTNRNRAAWIGISAALIACGGCNLDVITQQIEEASEQAQLVGVRGTTLEIMKADYAPGAFDIALTAEAEAPPVPETYRLYAVDLASGETKVVEEGSGAAFGDGAGFFHSFGYGGGYGFSSERSDASWKAAVNYEFGYVIVTEIATGKETRYLEGIVAEGGAQLVGLALDRLIVALHRSTGGEGLLVAIDLNTGDMLVMDRVMPTWGPDGVAFDGSRLVFAGIPDFDPATQALADAFGPGTLDFVDLATGQRRTLTGDVGGWGTLGVFLDGERVVWIESTETDFQVRAVDIASGTVETLDTFPLQVGNGFRSVIGANSKAVLLTHTTDSGVPESLADIASLTTTTTFTLRRFDGTEVVLLEFTSEVLSAAGYPTISVLTDEFAAVHDPATDELVVYTLATGETRRIGLPK